MQHRLVSGVNRLLGGPDEGAPLSIAPDDLRQLADHDARHRTFDGGAGPLTALDTGGDGARGTVLLVAGFTGSKEDFAPLLAPLSAGGYLGGHLAYAQAVGVNRNADALPGRTERLARKTNTAASRSSSAAATSGSPASIVRSSTGSVLPTSVRPHQVTS